MSFQQGMAVTMDSETALRQAPMTAHDYMLAAKHPIDEIFGKGYAKDHPELVGVYMQTAGLDFTGASQSFSLQEIARAVEALANSLAELCENARSDIAAE